VSPVGRKVRNTAIDYRQVSEQWNAEHQGQRKPTINDVAELAGVSKKTVSRVINNSPLVNEETRDGIQTVIQTIGYQPDPQARGLAFRRSFLVGMIYDNPNPQYVVNMQLGILDGLRGTAYELVVHPCDRDSDRFIEDAKQFVELQKLHGVILTPSISEDDRITDMLREIGCAYVRVASIALDMEQRMIVTNDRVGSRAAARHLAELGHERIAFIAGRGSFRSAHERRSGFEEGLAEFGLKLSPDYILQGNYTFESGLEQGAALLNLDPPPTAVFAANDEMAAGVVQALRIAGLDVPESLSVVGFDDFEVATRIWPRLTTVHSPTRDIGRLAAERLLQSESADAEVSGTGQTTPHLVERESTSSPAS